jgi:MFS family permease
LTAVAVPFQVYTLTHSSLWVGVASLIQFPLLLVGTFIAGPYGDRYDRRYLVALGSAIAGVISFALALNAHVAHPQLWLLIGLAGVAATATGFTRPLGGAMLPRLLPREEIGAAYALFTMSGNVGLIAGPSLAGLVLAQFNIATCYVADGCSFAAIVIGTLLMRPQLVAEGKAREKWWSATKAGWRYVREHPLIQAIYLVDVNAMVFGLPRALFPAMAVMVYHGGPRTLGLLYAAPGVGSVLMGVVTGWLEHVRRQGRLMALVVVGWGLAMAAFGLVHVLWIGLIALAVAGATDMISVVLRNAVLQKHISEEFRSRITSIQTAVGQGGPRVGDFESGVVASFTSIEFAVVSGGLACIAGIAALLAWRPHLWRQTSLEE